MTDLWQPPHSIEAERAVLAAILADGKAYDAVGDRLVEADFYANPHRVIWRTIVELVAAGKEPDGVTLLAALPNDEEARGIAAILPHEGASPRMAERYAEIVRERSIIRRLAAASTVIGDLAHFPEGRKSDELLQAAEAILAGLIDNAPSADAAPIGDYLGEVLTAIERRMEHGGEIQGLSTGLEALDAKTNGLQNGDLVVIAGRTSMGKTVLGMQIAQHTAMRGSTALVFSLEMSREQLAERMLSNVGRVNSHAIRSGRLQNEDWEGLAAALGRLKPAKLLIDDTSPLNVTQIRARARRAKRRYELELIVIDYLGLLDGEGEKRHEQVADISRRLKGLARELNVPIIALAQLNRKAEDRTNKRPQLADLRDSGAVEQDADMVFLLYRDEYYNPETDQKGVAEINVAKNRMGETGIVRVQFDGEHSRFGNLSHDWVAPQPKQPKRRGMPA